jgi:mRNA interferase MazF
LSKKILAQEPPLEFRPKKGMVADFNLNPTKGSETGKIRPCIVVTNDIYNARLSVIQVVPLTEWSEKKSRILTNVTLINNKTNGLDKKSIADCLQTRPVDYTKRFVQYRGVITPKNLQKINDALITIFGLEI